jgi:formamidopyrimidine-DNA glycosylase
LTSPKAPPIMGFMPELPEVETIRRGLERHLPGRRIRRAEVRAPQLVTHPDWESFVIGLAGRTFGKPRRVGKILFLDLDSGTLLVHLGMTGQLLFQDSAQTAPGNAVGGEQDPHAHILLHHVDGTCLCYRDIRKFGKWRLYTTREALTCPELAGLGPDPLTPDFALEGFASALKRTTRHIKAVLLDQSVVAGMGNIYVDETLHRCGLRPTRRANKLSARDVRRLFEAIPDVLKEALERGGTTFSDYRDAEGNRGQNGPALRVYGRYGQPCLECGQELRRTTVAGRTSSWCAKCQK